MRRILVVHTGGGLGDVLLATPVVDALQAAWPQAEIDFLARASTAAAVERHPHVRELLTMPASAPRLAQVPGWAARLRARRYDAALVLWSRTALAWMLALAGIPVRVGQASRLAYSWLYTHRVRVRSEEGDEETHWTEVLLDYVRALGVEPPPPHPRFVIPAAAHERAAALLQGLGTPRVGFHSSKGMRLEPGRWPVDVFAGWARALHDRLGAHLVLTGGPDEVDLVAEVERLAGVPALNLAGRTDVPTLAAVASRCDVFVCPDSGPMHLAALVGTPTVGVYALEEDFPRRWAPVGARTRIVRPVPTGCRPGCRKGTCPDFRCYRVVTPDMVVDAVRGLLEPA